MTEPTHTDPNFITGNKGLIAVDKIGNKILFLHPESYETIQTLGGFAPRVHELAVSPDHKTAYVPIYGDGIHGNNPNPGHLIAVFDLEARRHTGDFSTSPFLAPHGVRWGPEGQLCCVCENSGVALEIDPNTGEILQVTQVGSNKAHRIEVLPNAPKLYTENEEDRCVSVVDLKLHKRIKKVPVETCLAGIGVSPDGTTIVLVDAEQPRILLLDTVTDEVVRIVELKTHTRAAQIARFSPNGKHLVVTSHKEPLATIFDGNLSTQRSVYLGNGPMNMAYHQNGRTVLVANHDEGTIAVVDLENAEVTRSLPAGVGIETLSFY